MSTRVRESVLRQRRELGLTRAETAILACIADRIPRGDISTFISRERICAETGYCRRWVMITLRRLEDKGLLIISSKVGGRGHIIHYEIPYDQYSNCIVQLAPPAAAAEEFDQEPTLPQIPETPQPKTLEEQLRFCRSIYNRQNVNEERKKYWALQIKELEKQLALDQAQGQEQDLARASPGQDNQVEEMEVERELLEANVQAQKIIEFRQHRDAFQLGSARWRRWNDLMEKAQEKLALLNHSPSGQQEYVT